MNRLKKLTGHPEVVSFFGIHINLMTREELLTVINYSHAEIERLKRELHDARMSHAETMRAAIKQ